ncbi:MAG: DNA adenine methylase, partial [Planctomycetota bacterium]
NFIPLEETRRKEFYLDIREQFNPEKISDFTTNTAAKLIFLNRTCFNGLYRVNKKGNFNVPFGRYKKPRICDEENLRAVSSLLQNTEVICAHFEDSRPYIHDKTFVYFDPPYRPLSPTASFTSYSKEDFSEDDQIRLAEFCKSIDKQGAKFLLSNSDPKSEDPMDHFFQDHYKSFNIDTVKSSRAINCKAAKRGQITELLMTNYKVDNC